ncbi:hypothetical protein [Psittacicella hinzii]|uniref:Lipoprotein n=1 Tax=Psittacicella hinzii TaxID=2028575 RepID=A0A3A1YPX5_9GAMM|nr:hypothetical protein [Psittacicella hinzii]RIY39581.1 hypothetical protein CKF58_01975 [Psittacicella hinzii]
MKKFLTLPVAALLISSSLFLSSCDKVNEVVKPVDNQQTTSSSERPQANVNAQYSPIDYVNLDEEYTIPNVYNGDYVKTLSNYNLLSTSYKNYLYRLAKVEDSPKTQQLLNEVYLTVEDVRNATNSEIVIFYIDTLRNLQENLQEGISTLAWTNGIAKNTDIASYTEDQKVAFLTDLTRGLNQLTDNFFAIHQFLGQKDFGLDVKTSTYEYESYQNMVRVLKNLNVALVQYDTTCSVNYQLAGDVINCLQQKYNVAYAALDTQLLNVFNTYLANAKNEDSAHIKENLEQLNKNLVTVINKNKQSFDYFNSLLAK